MYSSPHIWWKSHSFSAASIVVFFTICCATAAWGNAKRNFPQQTVVDSVNKQAGSSVFSINAMDTALPHLPNSTTCNAAEHQPSDGLRYAKSAAHTTPTNVIGLHVFPGSSASNTPLKIVATTRNNNQQLTIRLLNGSGDIVSPNRITHWGYIPTAYSASYMSLPAGTYRARIIGTENHTSFLSMTVHIEDDHYSNCSVPTPAVTLTTANSVWPNTRRWSPAMEDLYAAFVAKLFYVEPGSRKGWKPLHQATQDPFRNLLYGSLGYNEDSQSADVQVKMVADCGDTPYLVRAYFAWKLGLAFRYSQCSRSYAELRSWCLGPFDNAMERFGDISHPVDRFNTFVAQSISRMVHSGNARMRPEEDNGDFYPVKLTAKTIRPGVIFVDAGGHVILVSQVEPQRQSKMGTIYGIDGHPDHTVTYKQFSRGTFVFNHRVPIDGFKAFRPITRDNGPSAYLSNAHINTSHYLAHSLEQSEIDVTETFYQRMEKLFNPTPMDPRVVLQNKIDVFHAAAIEREQAVALGVEYMNDRQWRTIPMPDGADIFETDGPWEVYSTPARDLRFFLALDDVLLFPQKILQQDDTSIWKVTEHPRKLKSELDNLLMQNLAQRTVTYTRSDGSRWTLSLQELVNRKTALEMAYNPNDCPEKRWGAPLGSDERASCRRHAPVKQVRKMRRFRLWFAARRRPDQR